MVFITSPDPHTAEFEFAFHALITPIGQHLPKRVARDHRTVTGALADVATGHPMFLFYGYDAHDLAIDIECHCPKRVRTHYFSGFSRSRNDDFGYFPTRLAKSVNSFAGWKEVPNVSEYQVTPVR